MVIWLSEICCVDLVSVELIVMRLCCVLSMLRKLSVLVL